VLTIPEGISVRELVGYGRSPYNDLWGRLKASDRRIVDEAIERVQIGELADRWLHDLSGGQRQRAWLAMVLAQRAPLVLL
ncbi:ATP-binding cassette domain-containing protein, partial [Brevibacterium sp. SIMBA_078]